MKSLPAEPKAKAARRRLGEGGHDTQHRNPPLDGHGATDGDLRRKSPPPNSSEFEKEFFRPIEVLQWLVSAYWSRYLMLCQILMKLAGVCRRNTHLYTNNELIRCSISKTPIRP